MRKCKICNKKIKVFRKLMCNNCYRKINLGKNCIDCNKPIYIVAQRCKKCAYKEQQGKPKTNRGERNGRYTKGFRFKKGYKEVLVIGEGKYVLEHRKIIEEYLGRRLSEEEVVHHKNGNKLDNRVDNLQVFPNSNMHSQYHWDTNWKNRRTNAS